MKWFKYTVLFALFSLLLGVCFFFILIEKEDISQYIYDTTKKEITFDNYGLSFYPTLALTLSNVKYQDNKRYDIQVKKLLISFFVDGSYAFENFKIKALYLVEPVITVYPNKEVSSDNGILDISQIYVKNATISYESYQIQDLNLNASLTNSVLNIKNLNSKKWKDINEIDIAGTIDFKDQNPYYNISLIFKKSNLKMIAKNFNLKLPEFKDKNALEDVSFFTKIKGDISKLYIKETTINFDDTTISVEAIIKNLNLSTMVSVININQIDLNQYINFGEDSNTSKTTNTTNIYDSLKILTTFNHLSSVKIKKLQLKDFTFDDIFFKLKIKESLINIDPITFKLYEGELKGAYTINLKDKQPKFKAKQQIKNLEVSNLFDSKEKMVEGKANLLANVIFKGNNKTQIIKSVTGVKMLYGKNLIFNKYDIDKILSQYEKTKKVDLIDIGAMLVAGPFAGLLTQGVKFAILKDKVDKTGSTQIKEFSSIWKIKDSKAIAKDVAVRTQHNLIALQGEINLQTKEFKDIKIAILDKKGCAKYIQTLSGNLNTNDINTKEHPVETFLAPIASIVEDANKLFGGCKKFYKGRVKW